MGRVSKATAALSAAALLIVGGGAYALAASTAATITVCVSHKGGTLYKAKKCAKHDAKLRWNKVGRTGPQGATGPAGPQGVQGVQGIQGPSDGYFSQPSDLLTAINTTGTDFGAVNVSAGSYIVWATARLNSTGAGSSNADCFLRNIAGGNGLFENVNLAASPDRKIISALWSQTVSAAATFTLRCETTSGTVSVDKVAVAAIKVGTLH